MVLRLLLSFLLGIASLAAQDLAFSKSGRGPGMVLIHGFAGNRHVWGDLAREFPRHAVLAVDLPGCGGSAMVKGPVDFDAMADQVAALMKAQGLGPSAVVAHSMGGLVAVRVAARHPEQVSSLVLIDTPLMPMAPGPAEALAQSLEADVAAAFRARYALFAKDAAQLDRVVAEAARIPGPVLGAYTRARTVSSEAAVAKVACPVLLLASPILIPDPSKQEARLKEAGYGGFARLRVIRFPDARHWIMWDDPKGTRQALRDFLEGK